MKSASFYTRILALFVAFCVTLTVAAHDAEAAKKRTRSKKGKPAASAPAGVNDPRYAAVIMNPITGEIYHSQDADGKRYPASLTKMMTLYLLFDAIDKGKTSMDARMDISELAARQPQTNLSLSPGDSIPVETAIKALVVRSANDVAVVTAEALGGDVDSFAKMMTAKARQLGMSNTVFKNPSGLPNTSQFTTARDMAKLGIALKRDFPKYYHYFSTLQFSHDGVTYYTHNRVMLRYAGVDGIKTGYVAASGFNLVTSVSRGGRPIVGVVMGGASGGWRDNRMIQLLDQTYDVISSRGADKGKRAPENLPKGGKQAVPAGIVNDPNTPTPTIDASALPEMADTEDGALVEAQVAEAASPFAAAGVEAPEPPKPIPAPARPVATLSPPIVQKIQPATVAAIAAAPRVATTAKVVAPAAPAPVAPAPAPAAAPIQLANPPAAKGDFTYGIQVGAFSTHELAEQAANVAMQTASRQLVGAKVAVIGPASSGVAVHRARIENISQIQAKKACEALIASRSPCFIFKMPQ